MYLEKISRVDEVFLSIKPKLDDLFVQVILPQILIGKMQLNKPGCSSSTSSDAVITSYCYCQRGEEGYMVACGNPLRLCKWFHFWVRRANITTRGFMVLSRLHYCMPLTLLLFTIPCSRYTYTSLFTSQHSTCIPNLHVQVEFPWDGIGIIDFIN